MELTGLRCVHNQTIAEDWLSIEETERLIRESAIEEALRDGSNEQVDLHVKTPARLRDALRAAANVTARGSTPRT